MDKIRILLLDDLAEWTFDSQRGFPRLPRAWEAHFELFWLQNAKEGRWLLDAFSLLATRAPQTALRAGLPPELLVFDYALTQGGNRNRVEGDPTDIVQQLRSVLAQSSLTMQEPVRPPPRTAPFGKDRTGCYVGGELARVFGAHPCGAVPTTAHVDTSDTDAAFYEWLNEQYFMDLFKVKSRGNPSWDLLIPIGVASLRARMEHLAMPGLLRMSPSALQSLLEAPTQMRDGSLTIHSCYGQRTLPIAGLFADVLPPVKASDAGFAAEAKKWAGKWLAALFGSFGCNEFMEARALAAIYYDAYVSAACGQRYDLSALAALRVCTSDQAAELEVLCAQFGLDLAKVRSSPDEVQVTRNTLEPLRTAARSEDEVARWAALMLAVRAEQYWRPIRDAVSEEESDQPVSRYATLDDILQMLEPLPERLLTFQQQKKRASGAAKWGKETSVVTNQLKRLGHSKDWWGPRGLNLQNVLENRPFDCVLCRAARQESPPDGEHVDGSGQRYSHGLRAGEGALLRVYADEIQYPESGWPPWLTAAP